MSSREQKYKDLPWSTLAMPGFASSLIFLEALVLALFCAFTTYGETSSGKHEVPTETNVYPMFQDVHIMIFIGFGFLMTFLRKFGYSAVGHNFLLSAFAVQWAILCRGFFEQVMHRGYDNTALHRTPVRVDELINGDFAAGSVMIAFGAVIGKVAITELLWMTFFHIIFYCINEQILVQHLRIADIGGSLIIHTFGAFFGLAVSWVRTPRNLSSSGRDKDNEPVYHSDLFSMIGTIFLWCYWPSFNGALATNTGNASQRAVVNTYVSLTGSCVATFVCSRIFRGGKFEMVDVQNASLAGGVAVGAIANLSLQPWGALICGIASGIISQLGFRFLQARVWQHLNLHDTCGVLNLHGIPGVLSGFAAAIAAASIPDSQYGANIAAVYEARDPYGHNRDQQYQAVMQMVAVFVPLGMAITSGLGVGALLNSRLFYHPRMFYNDSLEWEVPHEELPVFFEEENRGKDRHIEMAIANGGLQRLDTHAGLAVSNGHAAENGQL